MPVVVFKDLMKQRETVTQTYLRQHVVVQYVAWGLKRKWYQQWYYHHQQRGWKNKEHEFRSMFNDLLKVFQYLFSFKIRKSKQH